MKVGSKEMSVTRKLVVATIGSAMAVMCLSAAATDFEESEKLVADDPKSNDNFGYSTAISGGIAVVGADKHDHDSVTLVDSGGVYVYARHSNGDWIFEGEIGDGDRAAGDRFGHAVDVGGDIAVVTAPDVDVPGTADVGAVFVYSRDSLGVWSKVGELYPSARDLQERFGTSAAVSRSGNTVVVGNSADRVPEGVGIAGAGSVMIYERDAAGAWIGQEISASSPDLQGHFGDSVAIDGDTLVVGAKDDDAGQTLPDQTGAAFVFVRDQSGAWIEQQELPRTGVAFRDQFGDSVGVSGDTAVVGAPNRDGALADSGAAYVYQRDAAGNWSQTATLVAFDNNGQGNETASGQFGESVSISGNRIMVGEFGSGAAYLFIRDAAGSWQPHQRLTASDAQPGGGLFGFSVDIDGIRSIVGAPFHNEAGGALPKAGSAYVFESASAAELTGDLVMQVLGLNLQQGIENALDAKLQAALQALDDVNEGNDQAAVNALMAFQNSVMAQEGGKIPAEQAQALHDAAQEVIDLLVGG